ncbi:MAG: hypothetical protein U9M92_01890 [Patescibacteria group bacterium]|nr:hypothetical protein [Patescibacteria group bacterium]
MLLDTWGNVLTSSFQNLWWGVVSFVPNLFIAIVIFLLGWLVGSVLGRWVDQLVRSLKIDNLLRGLSFDKALDKANLPLNSGAFIGGLVKWFVIIVFLMASMEVLGLSEVTSFLKNIVIGYLPNVIAAALILVVAAMIGDALRRVVVSSAKAAGVRSSHFLGSLALWAVWLFALIAALLQLGVAVALLQTLFTGLVAMLALAGGLAFGLGGKDVASKYWDKWHKDMAHHRD